MLDSHNSHKLSLTHKKMSLYSIFASTYMAGKPEEILCLSLAKEKDAKEVVGEKNHVREDESGYEVFLTSGS